MLNIPIWVCWAFYEKEMVIKMANKQENLILKHAVSVDGMENDVLTLSVPVSGLIPAKEGKETHVVTSGKFDIVRSDGKVVSVQINAWYK